MACLSLCLTRQLTPLPRYWKWLGVSTENEKEEKTEHVVLGGQRKKFLYKWCHYAGSHHSPWKFSNVERSKAKVVLYTKLFRKELNAKKYQVQHQQEKWHCRHHDHSSIDHTIAGFTSDIVVSPEQCRTLAKGKDITLLGHSIDFGFDTKSPIVKTSVDTSDDYRNEWDGRSWISRETFLPHMQTTTLKMTLENGKVISDTGLVLPCALEKLGCETTSLDPYA